MLNPRHTFESFIVGHQNDFACAAAKAVANAPGTTYNPLFIYGGAGLGKTHLLHAIGNHVSSNNKAARVACLSSEQFTGECIDAILNNQLAIIRQKYLQMDVLLIDDIQFLAGKERLQEEFFHIFNALHEAHKQIVLACSRPASEIPGLEQRLVSRFEWGQTADLQVPDLETRLAILRKKAQWMGGQVPDDILNFLAAHIRTDIRRLEGALIHVESYAALTGKKLTLEVVESLLQGVLYE
ncbi:MAG: chromosomal replication initiator protein DnaA [Verrucomicrobiota bacterium]